MVINPQGNICFSLELEIAHWSLVSFSVQTKRIDCPKLKATPKVWMPVRLPAVCLGLSLQCLTATCPKPFGFPSSVCFGKQPESAKPYTNTWGCQSASVKKQTAKGKWPKRSSPQYRSCKKKKMPTLPDGFVIQWTQSQSSQQKALFFFKQKTWHSLLSFCAPKAEEIATNETSSDPKGINFLWEARHTQVQFVLICISWMVAGRRLSVAEGAVFPWLTSNKVS